MSVCALHRPIAPRQLEVHPERRARHAVHGARSGNRPRGTVPERCGRLPCGTHADRGNVAVNLASAHSRASLGCTLPCGDESCWTTSLLEQSLWPRMYTRDARCERVVGWRARSCWIRTHSVRRWRLCWARRGRMCCSAILMRCRATRTDSTDPRRSDTRKPRSDGGSRSTLRAQARFSYGRAGVLSWACRR